MRTARTKNPCRAYSRKVNRREHSEWRNRDAHEQRHDARAKDRGKIPPSVFASRGSSLRKFQPRAKQHPEPIHPVELVWIVKSHHVADGNGLLVASGEFVDKLILALPLPERAGLFRERLILLLQLRDFRLDLLELRRLGRETFLIEPQILHRGVDLADLATLDPGDLVSALGCSALSACSFP
jgi:hypothetical protein